MWGISGEEEETSSRETAVMAEAICSLGWEDPLEEGMATHSSTGESHGQRSLAGYSLYGRTEPDKTEVT